MKQLRLAGVLPALLCAGLLCAGGIDAAGDSTAGHPSTVQMTVTPTR
jgi:hypothetical protein